jgi:hypothetical protein
MVRFYPPWTISLAEGEVLIPSPVRSTIGKWAHAITACGRRKAKLSWWNYICTRVRTKALVPVILTYCVYGSVRASFWTGLDEPWMTSTISIQRVGQEQVAPHELFLGYRTLTSPAELLRCYLTGVKEMAAVYREKPLVWSFGSTERRTWN